MAEFVTSAMMPRSTFKRLVSFSFMAVFKSPFSLNNRGEAGTEVADGGAA